MNKTIKVIDLLNKIANGEELPRRIKYKGFEYSYYSDICWYGRINHIGEFDDWFISKDRLNNEVEIIEEEPEIDIQSIQEVTSFGIKQNQNAINELIKAVKQLDDQINNKRKEK